MFFRVKRGYRAKAGGGWRSRVSADSPFSSASHYGLVLRTIGAAHHRTHAPTSPFQEKKNPPSPMVV
ncbi:unnamed protein product [Arctia plantaginis]|uniref:Uncharacterized protein n=1 Tax=Arctia plantaginis TaxID=874455 RepID=A0A8S0YV46_ARCPL|nr:unnamed protein product [Arctia plantaginis]